MKSVKRATENNIVTLSEQGECKNKACVLNSFVYTDPKRQIYHQPDESSHSIIGPEMYTKLTKIGKQNAYNMIK